MVGLVALPLALGFGASSGLGPRAGLVTAIVAGAVAAVFGGSRVQVSGPTGAMTVVLVPIVAEHGASGVAAAGLLAGVVLLALAVLGVGSWLRYVPIPVVEGFTLGIATIIALQQIPAALGVAAHADGVVVLASRAVSTWAATPHVASALVTVVVTVGCLALARLLPTWPSALLLVAAATAVSEAASLDVARIGYVPAGLPPPRLPSVTFAELQNLLLPALAIAALAALESLLSASVADAMTVGDRHDSDRELAGQGLANLTACLVGGVPATAAIARTAVNIRSGASSRLAALTHALFLLIITFAAASTISAIPRPAIAGVLIATAVQMVRVSSLTALLRATRGDATVLLVTAAATVLLDLVTAVIVGLVVAGFFALQQTARTARLDAISLQDEACARQPAEHRPEREADWAAAERVEKAEQALRDEHIVAYRLDGPLLFAAAHDYLLALSGLSTVKVVILRLSRVTAVDATGAHVLADTIRRLEARRITVLLSGIRPEHERILRQLGVHAGLAHEGHLFDTTPDAITHARLHAAQVPHPTPA